MLAARWRLQLCWLGLVCLSCPLLAASAWSGGETEELLAEFYHATNGSGWTQQCSGMSNATCWLSPGTHCQWYGVQCVGSSGQIYLQLANNGLAGQLPESLGRLQGLIALDLSHNPALGGPIPASVGHLTQLGVLYLYACSFSGPLPATIGNLSSLQNLDLKDNQLSGPLPDSLGDLTALTILRLSSNRFSGPIPRSLGRLHNLEELDLSVNSLRGPIPTELSQISVSPPGVVYLVLASNELTGTIPEELGNITRLQKLILSDNKLTGSIPTSLARLPLLRQLALNNNNLTGEIPVELYTDLQINGIDLGYNDLEGSIHDQIQTLADSSLTAFSIAGNLRMRAVDGKLPTYYEQNLFDRSVGDGRIFTCPSIVLATNSFLSISMSPEYYDYSLCECASNYHGQPPNQCFPCPFNCNCSDGSDVLRWGVGYYPVFVSAPDRLHVNGVAHPAASGDGTGGLYVGMALPCPDLELDALNAASACNPLGNCTATWQKGLSGNCQLCAAGTEGRLCSRCLCHGYTDCYFRSKSSCVKCESITTTAAILVAVLLLLLAVLVFVVYLRTRHQEFYLKLRRTMSLISDSGTLKILLLYLQTTSSLNNIWPDWALRRGMRYLDISNVKTSGLGLECVMPMLSSPFFNLLSSFALIPLATALIVVCVGSSLLLARLYRRCVGKRETHALAPLRASAEGPGPILSAGPMLIDAGQQPNGAPSGGADQQQEQEEEEDGEVKKNLASGGAPSSTCTTPLLAAAAAAASPASLCADQDGTAASSSASSSSLSSEEEKEEEEEEEEEEEGSSWGFGLYMWIYLLYLLFFEQARRAFEVFNCPEEPLTFTPYMQSLPWLRCSFDTEWGLLVPTAITALVLYVAGIPLLFAVLLFVHRKDVEKAHVNRWLGHLYYCYKPDYYWFEMMVIARRLALALVISVVPLHTPWRASLIFVVLLFSLCFQFIMQPFKKVIENRMEELALLTVTVTFSAQTAWRNHGQVGLIVSYLLEGTTYADELQESQGFNSTLVVLALALNLCVVCLLAVVLVWPLVLLVWRSLRLWWSARGATK